MVEARALETINRVKGFWNLPDTWAWLALHEIAPRDSKTVRPSDTPNQVISYLGLEDISQGQWGEVRYQQVPGEFIKSNCIEFDTSHVLYAKLRPYLNKVVVPNQSGVGSTEWVLLKPHTHRLLRNYLAWFLRCSAFVDYASKNVSGARMPRMRLDSLWQAPIPIPFPNDPVKSLAIQRRVVERVESLLAEIKDSHKMLEDIHQDTTQVIARVLDDVFAKLKSSQVQSKPIRSLIQGNPQYGLSKKASEIPIGMPILRMGNITPAGKLSLENLKYVQLSEAEEQKYSLKKGDILFNRTNSAELVGKSATYEGSKQVVFASYLIRLVCDSEKILPEYLNAYINSSYGRDFIKSQLTRAIGQVNVNAQKLIAMLVPVPEINVQKQLLAYINSVQSEVDDMLQDLKQDAQSLEQLEQSVLERAFQGKL